MAAGHLEQDSPDGRDPLSVGLQLALPRFVGKGWFFPSPHAFPCLCLSVDSQHLWRAQDCPAAQENGRNGIPPGLWLRGFRHQAGCQGELCCCPAGAAPARGGRGLCPPRFGAGWYHSPGKLHSGCVGSNKTHNPSHNGDNFSATGKITQISCNTEGQELIFRVCQQQGETGWF